MADTKTRERIWKDARNSAPFLTYEEAAMISMSEYSSHQNKELLERIKEDAKYEAIAFNNWVNSLHKEGFPKNDNGTHMDCWQLYDYFYKSEKRDIYVHHAKTFES